MFVGSEGSEGAWEAHVVASDAERDLAALQMTAADLPYLPLGDSDAIEAGRPVQVLGFPFGRQTEVAKRAEADVIPQVTVTAGSLSAARADDAGRDALPADGRHDASPATAAGRCSTRTATWWVSCG